MCEKDMRTALFHWYQEAVGGNPGPIATLAKSVETFYLFDLVSDELYNLTCYLTENLIEIEVLDASKNIIGIDAAPQEDLPFPDVSLPESEELPFA